MTIKKSNKYDIVLIFLSTLFIFAIGVFYLLKYEHIMAIIMFLLFINNIIYYINKFEKRFILLIFHASFFTFLLGKILINYLSKQNMGLGYPIAINLHILLCLSLTLYSIILGVFIYEKHFTVCNQKKNYYSEFKPLVDKRFMNLIKIIMYICAIPYFFESIEKVIFVQTHSYIDLYSNFNSMLPTLILKISSLYSLFFILYAACKPNKEDFKLPVFMYIFSGILAMGYGQRNILILNLLLVIVYGMLRNLEMPKDKKWITKKMVIGGICCLPLLITFLFAFQSMRYNISSKTNFVDSLVGFFDSQGGSVEIIGEGMKYDKILPDNNYTFGPLMNSINNNSFIHKIFKTNILEPHTYEMATQGNIFAHSLTYICAPDLYLRGGGMGSCYLAELFHDFSYLGIIIFNLLLGLFLIYLPYNKKSTFLNAFFLIMIRFIFYLPRDSATGFIANSFTITNIIIILTVYICYQIYIKYFIKSPIQEKTTLVILTNKYPYSTSESFLEPELKYYSQFDSVYIIPFIYGEKVDNQRSTPYQVVDLEYKLSLYIKLKSLIFSLFNADLWSELFYLLYLKNFTFNRFKQLISLSYHGELYYQLIYHQIGNSLNNKTVYYSYWLSAQSVAAVKLNKLYSHSSAISRAHGIDLYAYRNENNYQALRYYLKKGLDKIYFISKCGRQYFVDNYGFSDKYEVAYLGVEKNISHVKQTKNKPFHIVSCSSMIPLKRIYLIIESLSLIDSSNIKWTHIGTGELYDNLLNLATHKLVKTEFQFIGQLTNDEVIKFYKENPVDLFINTSEHEGLPVSIMEVMSFGIPVIGTQVGAMNEIISDNKNGYLIDKDFKIEILSDLILKLINLDDETYEQFRKNAYDTWMNKYNAFHNYVEFSKKIEGMVNDE